MPVESPDLNTYLCVQMGSLADIARILGMDAEANMWRKRAAAIVQRMIKHMWDGKSGLFRALLDERPIESVTPFNLYPLWTGQLPDNILGNPGFPMPKLANDWGTLKVTISHSREISWLFPSSVLMRRTT